MKYETPYPLDYDGLINLIKSGDYNKNGINTHIRLNNREHELDTYLKFLDLTTIEYKKLKIADKIKLINSGITELPICCICNKKHYITYRPYCSSKCYKKSDEYKSILSEAHKKRWANIDEETKKNIYKKVEETNIKKYGNKCSLNGKELIEKKKKTWYEKYGVDNPVKSNIVKEKIQNTCLEKYGNICPLNGKELIEKKKKTWYEKYGVDNPLKSPIIRLKILDTLQVTYGTTSVMSIPSIYDKVLNTIEKRTGYRSTGLANPIYKEKIQNTCLEKYGVINPFLADIVKEKIQNTCLEKYNSYTPNECISYFKKI